MTKTIEQKVLKFIDQHHLIKKGDKIFVAFSGGADSVFLLSFLMKFKNRFKIYIAAFHLNHQLRGKAALADENFCTEFCKTNNIKLIRVSKDVKAYAKKKKHSIEEAGREVRYAELVKAAEKNDCNKIATAHNASDNVETILLNFIKGSGLNGLAGIPVKRENIIRPILCLNADEIRKYLKSKKISYRLDKSNLSSDYERNFLRNEIIPKLKQRLNPKLEEKISNTSQIISDVNSFIEKKINQLSTKAVKNYGNKIQINLKSISGLDKSLRGIFLKSVIEKAFNIELSSKNIFDIVDLLEAQTGKSIHLESGIIAFRERDELILGKHTSTAKKKKSTGIKIGQKKAVEGKIISISEVKRKMFKFTNNKSVEFISGDGLQKDFAIKKWKAGDRFQPIGMKGTKKISDFLSDEKISSHKKNEQLVLTNSQQKIVWVIGLRIDERFKVTPESKKIFKLTVTE